MLCQLSYSHRRFDYSNCASHMSETVAAVEPSIANRVATVRSLIDRTPCNTFDSRVMMTWTSTLLFFFLIWEALAGHLMRAF